MENLTFQFEEGVADFRIPITQLKSLTTNEIPEDFKFLKLESGRYFYGYGSVPIVDVEGDKIELEAMREGSKDLVKPPYNKIFLGHDYRDIAIGIIKFVKVDSKGLFLLAKLNDSHERAEESWKSLNEGFLDGFSIGGSFLKVESEYDQKLKRHVNVIKKVIFREVSLTSIPANPEALTVGAFTKTRKIVDEYKDQTEKFKYFINVKKSMVEENETKEEINSKEEVVVESNETPQENVTEEIKEEVKEETKPEEKEDTKEEIKEEVKEEEVKEEPKEDPKKSETPLLDLLKKQIEELQKKTLELEKENNNLQIKLKELDKKKEVKKAIRQSIPSDSKKFQNEDVTKTPLLDFLRH